MTCWGSRAKGTPDRGVCRKKRCVQHYTPADTVDYPCMELSTYHKLIEYVVKQMRTSDLSSLAILTLLLPMLSRFRYAAIRSAVEKGGLWEVCGWRCSVSARKKKGGRGKQW
jgi:hypothetical protein